MTVMRAAHGTSGANRMVSSRARRESMIRVPTLPAHCSQTQKERQEAFAVQPHQVHEAVHDIGAAGHIARVLQQGQHGEKDDQDGQESDHRAHTAEDAIHHQARGPRQEHWPAARRPARARPPYHGAVQKAWSGAPMVNVSQNTSPRMAGQHAQAPQWMGRPAIQPFGQGNLPGAVDG